MLSSSDGTYLRVPRRDGRIIDVNGIVRSTADHDNLFHQFVSYSADDQLRHGRLLTIVWQLCRLPTVSTGERQRLFLLFVGRLPQPPDREDGVSRKRPAIRPRLDRVSPYDFQLRQFSVGDALTPRTEIDQFSTHPHSSSL